MPIRPGRVRSTLPARSGPCRISARGRATRSRTIFARMASDPDRPGSRPVASVARALALLDELGRAPEGLGVNELARRIGVNASTASRLLATLEAGGMVERAPAGGPYRLGLGLVALADGV